jgi:hypothetical protein
MSQAKDLGSLDTLERPHRSKIFVVLHVHPDNSKKRPGRTPRGVPAARQQWRDKDRDRWNAVHHKVDTIRIGVLGLRTARDQCATAADVATWLSSRGREAVRLCNRDGCPVPARYRGSNA